MKKVLVVFPGDDIASQHIDIYRSVRENVIKWVNIFNNEPYVMTALLEDYQARKTLSELRVLYNMITLLSENDMKYIRDNDEANSMFDSEYMSNYHKAEFIKVNSNCIPSRIITRDKEQYKLMKIKHIMDNHSKAFNELFAEFDIILQFSGNRKMFYFSEALTTMSDGKILITQPLYDFYPSIKYSGIDVNAETIIKILGGG